MLFFEVEQKCSCWYFCWKQICMSTSWILQQMANHNIQVLYFYPYSNICFWFLLRYCLPFNKTSLLRWLHLLLMAVIFMRIWCLDFVSSHQVTTVFRAFTKISICWDPVLYMQKVEAQIHKYRSFIKQMYTQQCAGRRGKNVLCVSHGKAQEFWPW